MIFTASMLYRVDCIATVVVSLRDMQIVDQCFPDLVNNRACKYGLRGSRVDDPLSPVVSCFRCQFLRKIDEAYRARVFVASGLKSRRCPAVGMRT